MLAAPVLSRLRHLEAQIEYNRMLSAQALIHRIQSLNPAETRLLDVEFKVFSQWGEDGIIQYLISNVPIENEVFVEFGVEDYREANTRFLLMNNDWKGLVMDGSPENIGKIKGHQISWRHHIQAVPAFITRENINELLVSNGIKGDIGLLSVDIDGNDYWVWEAIDVVSPRIVICEYNSILGPDRALTIPYKADFFRTSAHFSNHYFGASLKAFYLLAQKKGYTFVGCNRMGANAFFVRNDVVGNLYVPTLEEGFVETRARESRNPDGSLSFLGGKDRIRIMEQMEMWDVEAQKLVRLKEII